MRSAMVHRCSFCGWERPAASPTMLDPHCERCGCVLEPAEPSAAGWEPPAQLRALGSSPKVARTAGALAVLPVLLAAAKVGYSHGGAAVAGAALFVAALALFALLAPAPSRRR